jgi:hypothetical protein
LRRSPIDVAGRPVDLATGGGGVTFERRVAIRYLTYLLTGASSPELDDRRVVRVVFQQGADHPVDDLVVWADRDVDEEGPLSCRSGCAAGRALSPATLTQAISGHIPEGRAPSNNRGLPAATGYLCGRASGGAAQDEELASLARTRDAATFYGDLAVPGRFSRELRDRLQHLKALVAQNLEASGADSSEPAVDAGTCCCCPSCTWSCPA